MVYQSFFELLITPRTAGCRQPSQRLQPKPVVALREAGSPVHASVCTSFLWVKLPISPHLGVRQRRMWIKYLWSTPFLAVCLALSTTGFLLGFLLASLEYVVGQIKTVYGERPLP